MIVVLGLLALLAVGIILMLVPVSSNEEQSGFVLREIEPKVGEEDQLIDFRYSVRQVSVVSEAGASENESVILDSDSPAEPDLQENRIPDEPPDWPGDELFYLAATEEVDGDQRQPGLWAKVMALNAGDERRARFHYIRLRVAQIIENQPPPDAQAWPGIVSDAAEKTSAVVAEPGHAKKAVAEIEAVAEMEKVADVVVKVKEVAEAAEVPLLDDVVGTEKGPGLVEVGETGAVSMLEEVPEVEASSGEEEVGRAEKAHKLQEFVEIECSNAEQLPEVEAASRMQEGAKAEKNGRPEKTVGAKSVTKAQETIEADEFASILNHELVSDVIEESRPIGRLIRSANLLRDFSVNQYVTSADVRETISAKGDKGPEASSFFRRNPTVSGGETGG